MFREIKARGGLVRMARSVGERVEGLRCLPGVCEELIISKVIAREDPGSSFAIR